MGQGSTLGSALSFPASSIQPEPNYLLNPAHPDFKKIKIGKPVPFAFDPRLLDLRPIRALREIRGSRTVPAPPKSRLSQGSALRPRGLEARAVCAAAIPTQEMR